MSGWIVVGLSVSLVVVFALAYLFAHIQPHDALESDVRKGVDALGPMSVSDVLCVGNLQLAIALSRDLFGLRFMALFVGAALSLLGVSLLLTGITHSFSLSGEAGTTKGSLATASPGLVLIALGVAVVIAALVRTQTMQTAWPSACLGNVSGRVVESSSEKQSERLDEVAALRMVYPDGGVIP